MYGVLLALGPTGETVTLRAFSGRLDGTAELPGWAAPIPGVQGRADEARTFAKIERLQARLLALAVEPACVEVRRIEADYEQRLKTINANAHRARAAGAALDPGAARRALRAERTAALSPMSERHEALMAEVAQLKRERRRTSHELHARIREAYQLPSPAGVTTNVEAAFNAPSPGGAGECCAPKLLVEANRRGLRPTGLAEFWWGADSPDGSKVAGALYGPCEERCQPILGHLLCDGGLPVIYEDTHLLVVDKPAGLASVTGPDSATHDSVQARLQLRRLGARPAHRLDVATSGLLLVALHAQALAGLSAAFRERRVAKRYLAILESPPDVATGEIALRARPDEEALPRWRPSPDGKLSRTVYRVLKGARVEFQPLTGRTHQLRLAARYGLQRPIVGDALYGQAGPRLMLHASQLSLQHPVTGAQLDFASPAPF
jgi:tRNA pseudouridine32 synthase/23S rRNA pseudouridine746 synthase